MTAGRIQPGLALGRSSATMSGDRISPDLRSGLRYYESSGTPGVRVAALSADARLLERLAGGAFEAEVHSVFRRVVNLRCAGDGRLSTLAGATIDDAPDTLRLDVRHLDRLGLGPGTRVLCDGRRLAVGSSLEVSLDTARPWSPALPTLSGWPLPLSWLERFLRGRGVGRLFIGEPAAAGPLSAHTARLLREAAGGLGRGLAAGDVNTALEYGGRLVGLGPGLTPSGDDYLVGMATACAIRGEPALAQLEVLRRVVRDNAGATNEISHAAMAHAVRGRVRDRIVRFAEALVTGDPGRMRAAGELVIAIGGTSGTDMMSGLLAGLRLAPAVA